MCAENGGGRAFLYLSIYLARAEKGELTKAYFIVFKVTEPREKILTRYCARTDLGSVNLLSRDRHTATRTSSPSHVMLSPPRASAPSSVHRVSQTAQRAAVRSPSARCQQRQLPLQLRPRDSVVALARSADGGRRRRCRRRRLGSSRLPRALPHASALHDHLPLQL